MVAFYRRQAQSCWRLARLASSAKRRDRLLQKAREWDRHADEQEAQLRKEAGASALIKSDAAARE